MKTLTNFKTWSTRAKNASAALLFLVAYTISMVAPFVPVQPVSAAQICTPDQQGANDLTGQKDLTRMCKDNANLPTSQALVWNWDDTGWTGNNTGDACALYDTDNDGFANYSVCVTVTGTPATQAAASPRIYSCDDNSVDKCFSATLQPLSGTTCSVSITATQPFIAGDNSPNDATATCTVTSASVGGASAALIDVCSYPSQQPNSAPSDCIISIGGGKIEVKKIVSPTNDSGTFNLGVAGVVYATGGNGTTTGERAVAKGVTAFAETGAAGTLLSGYNISVECRSGNGTGSTLSVTTTGTGAFSVDVNEDTDIVCTITNTRQTGTVTLVKSVINDNGGQLGVNAFGLTIGGNAVASGQVVTLPAGVPVAINEAGATGYSFVSITGDPYKCPTDLGGTVTPVNGQNITCTITNDDQAATLIVNKVLVNDNGGTKSVQNFSYKVNGGSAVAFESDGSNSQTVNAGTYSVAEVAAPGYTTTYANSLNGYADCANLVIPNGGTATCTITNNDQPAHLTLVKNLIKDNGGTASATDWTLNASGPTSISGVTGSGAVTNASVSAGTYTLSETNGPTGYTASSWVCTGGTQNGASVTLIEGQSASCAITNNDNSPYLQLIKAVTNDNGGTATSSSWNLIATGSTQATSFQGTTGIDSTSVTNFLAGSYTLSESGGPSGYTAGSWSCTGGTAIDGVIQLILGQSAVCTINNNDNAPKLTLNKVLIKDNGGTATESDWTLTANGGAAGTLSGPGAAGNTDVVSGATFKAGTYTLSESDGPAGYTASEWSCTGGKTPNAYNQITINLGDDITCTITNNDKAGTLIVNKVLINDNGGTKTVQGFSYKVDGGSPFVFEADASNSHAVNAGTYSVAEVADGDYTTSYGNSLNGYTNCSDLVIPNGGEATCTITNNDKKPTLKLEKKVSNTYGGTAVATDWTLTATGPTSISGAGGVTSGSSFDAGSYTLSEAPTDLSGATDNYTATEWACNGYPAEDGIVRVALGQSVTCEITNSDTPGYIEGKKYIVDVNGSPAEDQTEAQGWTIKLYEQIQDGDGFDWAYLTETTTNADGSYSFDDLKAGLYKVVEVLKTGWTQIFGGSNIFSVEMGETYGDSPYEPKSDFGNFKNGSISGDKFEDVNHNSEWDEGEPTLEGWTMELYAGQGYDAEESEPIATTMTDEEGAYTFTNLEPGKYVVCEVMSQAQALSWVQTYPDTDEDGCYVVDIDQSGETNSNLDFGNFQRGEINGHKWSDLNGNAEHDEDEPLLAGWEITLMDNAEHTWKTTTDEAGAYSFKGLFLGQFTVCETMKAGWTQTYPVDMTESECHVVNARTSGGSYIADFGNMQLAKLTVVKDVQPDSTKAFSFTTDVAKDELGKDMSFSLTDDGTNLGTNMKKFENVAPGTYTISEDQLSGWKLDNIACTGMGVTMTRDGAKLTVKLVAGAVATCTFVNSFIPQVMAETFTLADTGTGVIVTSLVAMLTIGAALLVTLYRRKIATEWIR